MRVTKTRLLSLKIKYVSFQNNVKQIGIKDLKEVLKFITITEKTRKKMKFLTVVPDTY